MGKREKAGTGGVGGGNQNILVGEKKLMKF